MVIFLDNLFILVGVEYCCLADTVLFFFVWVQQFWVRLHKEVPAYFDQSLLQRCVYETHKIRGAGIR